MDIEQTIKDLKNSNLYAECECGGEFKLSSAILFDGTKPFPKEAIDAQKNLEEGFKEKEEDLKKIKKSIERSEISGKSTNIGQKLEVILPIMTGFKWSIGDCRSLGDPIDMISFNGFLKGKVNSLSFIEIKSGKSPLNSHQKAVKEAIEDKRVSYRVFK